MHLYSTRKLLDELKEAPKQPDTPADPLFQWTAHLITLNRRKTVVVVHVASQCLFMIHGLTAKTRARLGELLMEGMRKLLESEYIRPEIIQQYLADCGETVTFGPNPTRPIVTICNRACERVRIFSELLDPADRFQQRMLPWLNSEPIAKAGFMHAHEVLLQALQARYGTDIQAGRAVELEVELALETPCRRILVVPDNLSLYQLHKCLQAAFGWKDRHLHQFILEADPMGRPTCIAEPDGVQGDEDIRTEDSLKLTVEEAFADRPSILYEYDFGDDWTHIIRCKGVLDHCPQPYPHCTDLVGDAPMEDCGGPGGFAEILHILKDPADPEYASVKAWVEAAYWEPADLKRINRLLLDRWRISLPVTWR